LRRRIGRLRRRIDGRLHATERQARRLTSWRTYLRGYPLHATVAAFGVGLALAAGLSAKTLARKIGVTLVRRATNDAWRQLRRELIAMFERVLAEFVGGKNVGDDAGAEHERA